MRRRLSMIATIASLAAACSGDAKLQELQRVKSGELDVVLLSSRDALKHGQDSFVIEFRSPAGALVDVGDVKGNATMPMPGAPMFAGIDVRRSNVPGRYDADIRADMAGTWRVTLEWSSPSAGSVTFPGTVQ